MTIESNISAQTLLGDGEARVFPFTFKAFAGQVKVIVTAPDGGEEDVTSLCGVALEDTGGGLVSYPLTEEAEALPSGYKITILRSMDFTQETNLVTGARYSSEVLEQCLDKLTAQDQELKEELGRTLKVGVASDIPGGDIIQEVLNASSEAKAAAQNSSLDAGSAAASAELAYKWATNPEDEPVAGGTESGPEFSAKHYASKLADIVERGVVATPAVPGFVPMGGEAGQVYMVTSHEDELEYNFRPAGEIACNTRNVLTTSGTFIAPVTSWYRVTCIGGGSSGFGYSRNLGGTGGTTTFSSISAQGGGYYTTNSNEEYRGSGGFAGEVKTDYIKLIKGQSIPYVIGAGGIKTMTSTLGFTGFPGALKVHDAISSTRILFTCGNGGFNGTEYGGAGGGGYGPETYYEGFSGASTGNAELPGIIEYVGPKGSIPARNGGQGAVILEYFDPEKLA